MSDYFGKAVFKDGTELFLVYVTSPGWTLPALFATLDEAKAWKAIGCPGLDRADWQAVKRSRASEEPVHILIDLDSPERECMWFYSTASRAGMVITGPSCSSDAEEANLMSDGIYTKEFFDSWGHEVPSIEVRKVAPRCHCNDGYEP